MEFIWPSAKNKIGETDASESEELPQNYFQFLRSSLTYSGIRMYSDCSRPLYIWATLTSIGPLLWGVISSYEIYANLDNPPALLNDVPYWLNYVVGPMSIYLTHYNRQDLMALMDRMEKGPLAIKLARCGYFEVRQIKQAIYISIFQVKSYLVAICMVLVMGFGLSFIMRLQGHYHLPLLQMTVINIERFPQYELAFLYHMLSLAQLGTNVASVDCMFAGIIIHIKAQLNILNESIKTIHERAVKDFTKDKGLQPTAPEDIHPYLHNSLRDIVEHHKEIISVTMDYNKKCHFVLLVKFIGCNIILCFTLYSLTQYEIGSVDFIKNVIYYVIMIGQLLMFCFWGDICTNSGQQTALDTANIRWTGEPLAMQRAIVMIVRQAQQTLHFKAGKIMEISMQTYVTIIKGGFTYFMVLRQMNDEDA